MFALIGFWPVCHFLFAVVSLMSATAYIYIYILSENRSCPHNVFFRRSLIHLTIVHSRYLTDVYPYTPFETNRKNIVCYFCHMIIHIHNRSKTKLWKRREYKQNKETKNRKQNKSRKCCIASCATSRPPCPPTSF